MRLVHLPLLIREALAWIARLIVVVPLATILVSCGGGSAAPAVPPSLSSIAVTPANSSVPLGLTQQLTATGTYSDSSTKVLTTGVTWNSGTPSNVSVNSTTGLAKAVSKGLAKITAAVGNVSGSTIVVVAPAALQSLAISPNPVNSGIGYPQQLSAIGTYSDGSTANVTNAVVWSSTSGSVATVGASTGLTTGVALGSTTIVATSSAVKGSAPITVAEPIWLPAGNLAQGRHSHTATLLATGKVLVVGGIGGSGNTLASAELYDPATNLWSAAGSMATARVAHSATLLTSGQVLVAGGSNAGPSFYSTELYDPTSNSWSPAGNLNISHSNHTATLLANGQVLVAGGECFDGNLSLPPICANAELYDPVANTWSMAASMANPRAMHTATQFTNGQVLVAGGLGYVGTPIMVGAAELYDPVANTWSSAGTLVTPRSQHAAVLFPNGKVLIAGGQGTGNNPLASAEIYDPVANNWSAVGAMSTVRSGPTGTLLGNGMVLIVDDASAELFDPTTNTWSSTVSPAYTREFFRATLLPSGHVLVSGGQGDNSAGLPSNATAELYW
jgi:Bacterial Ig-like domain (group 2)/Kelch motif/Galactose oxidase, central domain